jgi:hypothetical protein
MSRYSTVFISLLAMTLISTGFAREGKVNWEMFGENLIWGIRSGNEGLQRSAMCFIIKYADHLEVDEVSSNIYQIFSSHENPKMRQLALVTLYKMNCTWCLKYLVDDIYKETDPTIRHQIAAILKEKPILYAMR